MFGHNQVHSPKSYKDEPKDSLVVTSMFYTLQGEGVYGGVPAVFVRLKGCNLVCSFCDTYFDAGDTLTFNQIIVKANELIEAFETKHPTTSKKRLRQPLMVITGGEPLLQPNLSAFLKMAHESDFKTQIESNGTVYRDLPDQTHLVLSPKINEKITRYVKVNEQLLNRADTLKFVVSTDMPGYTDVPEFAVDWFHTPSFRKRNLFVSPMNCYTTQPVKLGPNGTLEGRSEIDETISFWTPNLLDLDQNQKNHEYAALLAMKYGCRLSLQMHLYASLP